MTFRPAKTGAQSAEQSVGIMKSKAFDPMITREKVEAGHRKQKL